MAKKLGRSGSEQLGNAWIGQELAGCEFQDERLAKRFEKLFRQLSGSIGESIPWPGSVNPIMYGPSRECKRKMKVASWSAQMYTAFVGVLDSWPGWNALRSAPI